MITIREQYHPLTKHKRCMGYKYSTTDGTEYGCEYEPDISCDECMYCVGTKDPRILHGEGSLSEGKIEELRRSIKLLNNKCTYWNSYSTFVGTNWIPREPEKNIYELTRLEILAAIGYFERVLAIHEMLKDTFLPCRSVIDFDNCSTLDGDGIEAHKKCITTLQAEWCWRVFDENSIFGVTVTNSESEAEVGQTISGGVFEMNLNDIPENLGELEHPQPKNTYWEKYLELLVNKDFNYLVDILCCLGVSMNMVAFIITDKFSWWILCCIPFTMAITMDVIRERGRNDDI